MPSPWAPFARPAPSRYQRSTRDSVAASAARSASGAPRGRSTAPRHGREAVAAIAQPVVEPALVPLEVRLLGVAHLEIAEAPALAGLLVVAVRAGRDDEMALRRLRPAAANVAGSAALNASVSPTVWSPQVVTSSVGTTAHRVSSR
jgi:hypothetical protein